MSTPGEIKSLNLNSVLSIKQAILWSVSWTLCWAAGMLNNKEVKLVRQKTFS